MVLRDIPKLMDEPTAGLDPKERVRLRNLLADLAKDRIVLLSTHIVSDVESIADRVFLMKQGAFVLEGTVAQLVEKMQSGTNIALITDAGTPGICRAGPSGTPCRAGICRGKPAP